MLFLNKIKLLIDKCLFFLLFIVIAGILVCVSLQVFSRYILKVPFVFTEELVRFLLIWLGLLGASYTFGKRGHIALTLFSSKFYGNTKFILDTVIDVLIVLFAILIMIIGGFNLIKISYTQLSSVLTIPIWWVYSVCPISGIIILFYQIYFILLRIKKGENE